MAQNHPRRLLLVRMDRIGDLILTLPVDEALTGVEASWWITQGLGFIAVSANPRRNARELKRKIRLLEFLRLLKEIRRERFDAAIIFHGPWWVSFLFWLARIPIRAGVKSQWHSYLFLNRAIRQKRSRAEMSELEYNFQLVERALQLRENSLKRSPLRLVCEDTDRASVLQAHGLVRNSFYVVHPGMGGSALNWPLEHYVQLIHELSQTAPVVITGTATDEPFLSPIRNALQSHPTAHPISWLDGRLDGRKLIALLSSAKAIVAPSTGVLHIAASTGQPTIGIFSPVRVQQPRRWRPQGVRVKSLMPSVKKCPGEMRCLGPECEHFDCMRLISPHDVLEAVFHQY